MNWFEFAFATFIFLTFLVFILIVFSNKFSSYIDIIKDVEKEKISTSFENILLSSGIPDYWERQNKTPISFGLGGKLYFREITVDGLQNNRTQDIARFQINLDEDCKKNINENSIRIIEKYSNEINYTLINKDYCINGSLKNATFLFFDHFDSIKNYYVYYSSENIEKRNYSLNSSLVAYFDFEDQINPGKDKTYNENDGIVFNQVIVSGIYGNALNFSENSFVNVSNNKNMNNSKISIEIWIKISDFGYSKIIEKYDSYGIYLDMDKLKGFVNGLPDNYQPLSYSLEKDKWYHIVFTSDGSNHKLYINGNLYNQTNYNIIIPVVQSPFSIGADYNGQYNFHGVIDEVRVYSSVLSNEEIFYANKSKPLEISINPEIQESIISLNKLESARNMSLDELQKILGFGYRFYIEVRKE